MPIGMAQVTSTLTWWGSLVRVQLRLPFTVDLIEDFVFDLQLRMDQNNVTKPHTA